MAAGSARRIRMRRPLRRPRGPMTVDRAGRAASRFGPRRAVLGSPARPDAVAEPDTRSRARPAGRSTAVRSVADRDAARTVVAPSAPVGPAGRVGAAIREVGTADRVRTPTAATPPVPAANPVAVDRVAAANPVAVDRVPAANPVAVDRVAAANSAARTPVVPKAGRASVRPARSLRARPTTNLGRAVRPIERGRAVPPGRYPADGWHPAPDLRRTAVTPGRRAAEVRSGRRADHPWADPRPGRPDSEPRWRTSRRGRAPAAPMAA